MNKYSASIFNYLFIPLIHRDYNKWNNNGAYLFQIYVGFYLWRLVSNGNIAAMLGLIESGFASVITQKCQLQ